MRRVLLMGYFGAGNLGDDMLLADWLLANRASLEAAGTKADVLSRSTNPVYGFNESTQLEPLIGETLAVKAALSCNPRSYAALIAPGGSLLQDATSQRSLLFYLWLIWRFVQTGGQVFLLNQGIGPLHGWATKALLPEVLSRCTQISLRDEASLALLRSFPRLARAQNLGLSCDPVLAGRLSVQSPLGFTAPFEAGGYIAVIPKGNSDLHSREVAAVLRALAEDSGLPLLLIPMHSEQDQYFCALTAQKLGLAARLLDLEELHGSCVSYNSAVISLIAHAAFVVSHRLHGLVTAQAYGVPAFGLAYDPKVSAFCSEAGLPWLAPQLLTDEASRQQLLSAYRHRSEQAPVSTARRRAALSRLEQSESAFGEALWSQA